MNDALPRLMLVTDRRRTRGRELVDVVAGAVRGGVGIVQIREKDLARADLCTTVAAIAGSVSASTVLCVNSDVEIARGAGTGLHLPAGASIPARRRLALVGRSVHDCDEAELAVQEGADYLVLGPVYPTAAKPGHPGCGPELLEPVVRLARQVPVFAIGGIEVSRVPDVIHAGAYGIAVAGAILAAPDPRRVAEALSLALKVACPLGSVTTFRKGA